MEENVIDNRGFSRRLFCVEYPGIVKNEDKMIETLGGLTGISRVSLKLFYFKNAFKDWQRYYYNIGIFYDISDKRSFLRTVHPKMDL